MLVIAILNLHFFAAVHLLLEIVLSEPDPVGTATRSVLLAGVAGIGSEVMNFVGGVGIASGLLMPSQIEGGLRSSVREGFVRSELHLVAIDSSVVVPSGGFFAGRAGHGEIF